jgi:prevent-host-death family protein
MTKTTLAEAKTQLEALVDAALRGERVVITRGSKPAVAIVPADESPALHVSNAAADYLVHEARTELEAGVAQVHESPATLPAAITKPHRRT